MGQIHKKIPCPKIRIFDYPAVIDFSQKMEVTVMAPNNSGDPLGSILGPMGSHWVQKMRQSHKKWPCPKLRIFDYPAVIDFSQKMEVTVVAPNHRGDPIGSFLGPMVSHWVKNMGQSYKKLPWPKIRIFDYGFFAKNGSYGNGAKLRWGSPRVHLGANGVPSGPKNGSKPLKITMPQISNFPLPRGHGFFAVINFSQKMEVTVMAPNHGGDPLGSILGSIGSHWVQKMGQNRKK